MIPLWAMHIPDGFLSPAAAAATGLLAIAGLAYCLRQIRQVAGQRMVPLVGVTAAAIFAGQMVNFPLLGLQASGHLLGGVLAAVVLGPWGGAVAMAAVLVVQCLAFADGGVTALGANIVNMALIGSVLGYACYAAVQRAWFGARGTVVAAVLASWLVIPLAALAFALEMSWDSAVDFRRLATLMLFYHVWIGLGEAAITGLVVAWIVRTRPDLIYEPARAAESLTRWRQAVVAGCVLVLAVAVFFAPLASPWEDGLEKVASRLGFADRATQVAAAPFPDYAPPSSDELRTDATPAAPTTWPASFWDHSARVTAAMGVLGSLVTMLLAWLVSRGARWGAPRPGSAHVA